MTFILDNSVAMRWCFESAAHPYADGILKRLAAGEDALVFRFIRTIECNALVLVFPAKAGTHV